MASWPPKKGTGFTFDVGLWSQADPTVLQSTPTLAAGDVKFYLDGGSAFNPATLPSATGKRVAVTVSSSEANADRIYIYFSDAAGAEWFDLPITIFTSVRQVDDLAFPNTTGRGMNVSSTGAVDSNNTQWLGTSSGMKASGPLASTDAPTNWSASLISSTGAYDANVTKVSGASSGAGFIDVSIASRASSTSIPTNLQFLTVSSSQGWADANVIGWKGTTGAVLAGGPPGSTDYTSARAAFLDAAITSRLSSTTPPTNWAASSITAAGVYSANLASTAVTDVKNQVVAGLSSDLYAEPTSALPTSNASLAQRLVWVSALAGQTLMQVSTLQSLLNSSSGATAVATAVLVPTTSQFTRTRWS